MEILIVAKKNIITYVPVVIVMLISVSALVPGILHSGLSDEVEQAKDDLNDLQVSYDYFVELARYVFEYDSNLYGMIWHEFAEAKRLDIELSTLGANATELQNLTYVSLMVDHLMNAHIMADQTYSFQIHIAFTLEPEKEIFHLGRSSTGYFFEIAREDWAANPTYIMTTFETFITTIYDQLYTSSTGGFFFEQTMQILENNFSEILSQPFGLLYADDTLYTLDQRSHLFNLTQTEVFKLEADIDNTVFVVQDGEYQLSRYQLSVSVLTVATIMSTAIAGRLEERKISSHISRIRADVKDDESLLISSVDAFSLILLFIALGIAAVGVLFAFVL